jgi:hypothetical protein
LGSNATDALVFGTDIAAGGSVTINIPVRLDAGVPAGTMLTNTVSVTSPSITGTVSASVSVPVAWQLFFPMIFKDAVFTSTVTTTVQ